jgi:hypothetical protein
VACLSALTLVLAAAGGCGLVYTRITQAYGNKQVVSKAQAIAQINAVMPAIMNPYWSQFQSANESGIFYIKNTELHYEQKFIAFKDVWGIRQHGIASTPGNVEITLLDKNGNSLCTLTFVGSSGVGLSGVDPNGVGGNSAGQVRLFLSSFLAVCPNVK